MLDHHLHHLPVVDKDKLVGIVTWRDIHRAEAWDDVDFGVDVITEDCIPMTDEVLNNRHVMTQWEYMNRYFHAARWVGQHENVELVQLNSCGCGPDPFLLDEIRSILAEYGKRLTIMRSDEIESTGSTKPRRATADGHSVRIRIPRKTTKPYQPEDRVRTFIVPDFAPFCSPPIVRPFIDLGYQIVQLPEPDHASVDAGLKYTNNEICYLGIITLGDLVKALQSGNYDLSRTAIGFSQTGGQWRATSYPSIIKKALVAAGFEQVPVVTLSTSLSVLNDQPGFKFNRKGYMYKAVLGMMFNDALSEMNHSTIIREKYKGETQTVADKYMKNRPVHDGDTELSQTRDQIVESAFHLFAEQGYHAMSMRQIARNAGVLTSNVYNYFDGKDAIYRVVLEQYHPWLAFHDDLTVRYASDVKVSVFDLLQFLAGKWQQNPDGLRLHLVELLEFQGQHIAMVYNRLQGMIASFISCRRRKNRSVDQEVEKCSVSAVALFYVFLFDQCLKPVKKKTTSRKTMLDLKTLLNLWNGDAFSETSHNHLSHIRSENNKRL